MTWKDGKENLLDYGSYGNCSYFPGMKGELKKEGEGSLWESLPFDQIQILFPGVNSPIEIKNFISYLSVGLTMRVSPLNKSHQPG